MPLDRDLETAFHEQRRHPELMPFVFDDAVELEGGPDAGLRGSVIATFMDDSGLSYTVELSTGRDIQVSPSDIRLVES